MTASMAKTEEIRFNKFVWASADLPKNHGKPASETKIPISSRNRHQNNRTARTEGLIGVQNCSNFEDWAFYF